MVFLYQIFSIQDECDQLALTIGRVMEEAGEKVEVNIDEIKSTYTQRLQKFEDIIKKVCNLYQLSFKKINFILVRMCF